MKLTIITPVLNEANNLPRLQEQLNQLTPAQGVTVTKLLVDGGSNDDSVTVAKSLGFELISAERGRASQQNAGACFAIEHYKPDVLLFLHADTQLPDNSIQLISEHYQNLTLKSKNELWGRFDVQLDSSHWLLKLVSFMINWRSRLTKVATGDQAIFVSAKLFQKINGFTDIPLMEDVEICKRLRKIAKPICLREKAITSARRWEKHGMVKTILLMWRLRFEYWLGVSPEKLAVAYGYKPKKTNAQTHEQTTLKTQTNK